MLSCPSFQRISTSFSDGCAISAISGRSVETPPMARVLTCAARFSATRRKARALSDSGMDWTMGFPSSEVVRISVERGISPKKGTSLAAANRRAPPLPKISSRWPQCRHSKPLMFSTNPRTGVRSLVNMKMAFSATLNARSCGVQLSLCQRIPLTGAAVVSIPGTGRQINEQVVELAPLNATEELVNHLGEHGPPPDGRLSFRREEAHRHDLHAVADDLNDRAVLRCGRSRGAHDGGSTRPVDIGVHQAHPGAQLRQRDREIRAHGGLPDAALPAGDGNDVLDQRDELVLLLRLSTPHLRGHLDLDVRDAREGEDRPMRVLLHLVADGTGWSGELDGEGNVLAVDLKVLNEAERDDVPTQVRVLDLAEGRTDVFRRDCRLCPFLHAHLADVSTWRWSRAGHAPKWHPFSARSCPRRLAVAP